MAEIDQVQQGFRTAALEVAKDGKLSEPEKTTMTQALSDLRADGGDAAEAMEWLENRSRLHPAISTRHGLRAIADFLKSDMDKADR